MGQTKTVRCTKQSGQKTPTHFLIVHKLYHFNCLSLDEVNANIQSGMSILWCKLSGNVKLQFNLFEGLPYLPESRTRSQMKWQRGVGRGRKTTGVQETNWRWGGKHSLQRGRAGVSPPQNYRKGWLEKMLSSPCSEKMLLQPVKRNFMCSIFATIPPEWTQKGKLSITLTSVYEYTGWFSQHIPKGDPH